MLFPTRLKSISKFHFDENTSALASTLKAVKTDSGVFKGQVKDLKHIPHTCIGFWYVEVIVKTFFGGTKFGHHFRIYKVQYHNFEISWKVYANKNGFHPVSFAIIFNETTSVLTIFCFSKKNTFFTTKKSGAAYLTRHLVKQSFRITEWKSIVGISMIIIYKFSY